ncbi:phosphatase PAP2 family protein [Actinacidiphila sp. ITFR-21]|uniref:phosphatase PAP2 family protein n=1 Tax=Actinacidiphila sp. ITFR-21 TaxID=3075199 RepID=UPI002889D93C|nr:phosphatase PAP2 family protein [Streptomyces sp. ITFR-21]WNI16984.1 phosphatase PAP2 family protein [Streptomyces sp. ITFR-21]
MAEVANDSVNPDIGLLRDINGLAERAPHGVDRAVQILGDHGLIALVALLAVCCWWRVARRCADAPAAVAGVLWAPLAGGLALLLNIPIRGFVRRPRPYTEHDGLDVLARGGHHFSFVSDQTALTAAVAVALFMVSRRLGAVALLAALAEGFTQVYLGADYPTDVVGGFALGAATTLLLAPLALALLTALTTALATTRLAPLVRARTARAAVPPPQGDAPTQRQRAEDNGLAA